MKKTKVLFIASELTPIAKVGGLGDVVSALPQALHKIDIDARILLPRYENIKISDLEIEQKNIPIEFGEIKETITLYKTTLQHTSVYLVDNSRFLSRGPIYADTSAFVESVNEVERFLFFSYAAVQILKRMDFKPDILHLNDWHTALIPTLLRIQSPPDAENNRQTAADHGQREPKTLLTIHNLANQGSFPAKKILAFLGLTGSESKYLKIRDINDNINIFQQGILSADMLNTVSPTYAEEILTKKYGAGLEKTLQKRKNLLSGILNGIDTVRFDPRKDEYISDKYSKENANTRKNTNKNSLKKNIGLDMANDGPLFGIVSRLTDQKGIDLIIGALPKMVKKGKQLVFLGQGSKNLENKLLKAEKKYTGSVAGRIGFDAKLAQQIYAACDIFLMPSRFEPCGLGQMIAMRYGSVPIVRATGGLKDTVTNLNTKRSAQSARKATGFVFEKNTVHELVKTIERAGDIYKNSPKIWRQIQKNGMSQDFSWKQSAKKYAKLYKKLKKATYNKQQTYMRTTTP